MAGRVVVQRASEGEGTMSCRHSIDQDDRSLIRGEREHRLGVVG